MSMRAALTSRETLSAISTFSRIAGQVRSLSGSQDRPAASEDTDRSVRGEAAP